MKKIIVVICYTIGGISIAVSGIWGVIVCFKIVLAVFGSMFAYIRLVFFPILFAIAPWYALLALGDWMPLLICYGGLLPAFIAWGIAGAISDT